MLLKILQIFSKSVNKAFGFSYDEELIKILGMMDDDTKNLNFCDYKQFQREKLNCFKQSLEKGVASLYIDSRVVGVKVPENLLGQQSLVLNYSYNYHIPDFNFDENGVTASLSFQRVPYLCYIPWIAVFGIANHSDKSYHTFVEEGESLVQEKAEIQEEILTPEQRRKSFRLIQGGKI